MMERNHPTDSYKSCRLISHFWSCGRPRCYSQFIGFTVSLWSVMEGFLCYLPASSIFLFIKDIIFRTSVSKRTLKCIGGFTAILLQPGQRIPVGWLQSDNNRPCNGGCLFIRRLRHNPFNPKTILPQNSVPGEHQVNHLTVISPSALVPYSSYRWYQPSIRLL